MIKKKVNSVDIMNFLRTPILKCTYKQLLLLFVYFEWNETALCIQKVIQECCVMKSKKLENDYSILHLYESYTGWFQSCCKNDGRSLEIIKILLSATTVKAFTLSPKPHRWWRFTVFSTRFKRVRGPGNKMYYFLNELLIFLPRAFSSRQVDDR